MHFDAAHSGLSGGGLRLLAHVAAAGVWAVAGVPLFIALGIVRLLVVALPAGLDASPVFLVHAFFQFLVAAGMVCGLALWRHGARAATFGARGRRAGAGALRSSGCSARPYTHAILSVRMASRRLRRSAGRPDVSPRVPGRSVPRALGRGVRSAAAGHGSCAARRCWPRHRSPSPAACNCSPLTPASLLWCATSAPGRLPARPSSLPRWSTLRRRAAEALAVSAVALLVTVAIAAPVLRAPSERIFGMEIVGRHHDPFTVMEQFARPTRLGVYSQPVTDITGAALARVSGAVAAYNWLVLLSFPLSAAAAYLLARHLALSPAGALLAALLFAFSPFHLAHAAYHPHIAQTQWLPLYLLALWRCLDEATRARGGVPAAATAGGDAVELLRRLDRGRHHAGRDRRLLVRPRAIRTAVPRRAVSASPSGRSPCLGRRRPGVRLVDGSRPSSATARPSRSRARISFATARNGGAISFRRSRIRCSAALARRIWTALERRTTACSNSRSASAGASSRSASIAVRGWLARQEAGARPPARRRCRSSPRSPSPRSSARCRPSGRSSASPSSGRRRCSIRSSRCSGRTRGSASSCSSWRRCWPASASSRLLARGTRAAPELSRAGLVALAIAEYAVSPPALSRDVLPTAAHRWVMRQPAGSRVLDCAPLTQESASVVVADGRPHHAARPHDRRLRGAEAGREALRRPGTRTCSCATPGSGNGCAITATPKGFHVQARFADADIFAVTPREPLIYTQR